MSSDRLGPPTTLARLAAALLCLAASVHAGGGQLSTGPGGPAASGNDGVGGIERHADPPPLPLPGGQLPPPAGWNAVAPTLPPNDPAPGSWSDLGLGLGGSLGVPGLTWCVDPLTAGLGALWISGGQPDASLWLLVGLDTLALPFRGGVLVPRPDVVIEGLRLGGDGTLLLPVAAHAALPPTLLVLQAWIADASAPQQLAATNGMELHTP